MQNYYLTTVMKDTATQVQLTFVGTIAFIFINGMGPPMQILKSILGARLLIGLGCILMCLGLILAGFSTQVSSGRHCRVRVGQRAQTSIPPPLFAPAFFSLTWDERLSFSSRCGTFT
jgi:Na+/melibiose symporter-like transporter